MAPKTNPTPNDLATAKDKTKVVRALVPLHHDGVPVAPGEMFEIGLDSLDQLLEVNAVELVEAAAA